ncbi:hypothetical protein J6590_021735 [Homalodisca vitripennis]|nr:hypothetical protein J6590_021735 [Homalodisca vitripennis]
MTELEPNTMFPEYGDGSVVLRCNGKVVYSGEDGGPCKWNCKIAIPPARRGLSLLPPARCVAAAPVALFSSHLLLASL